MPHPPAQVAKQSEQLPLCSAQLPYSSQHSYHMDGHSCHNCQHSCNKCSIQHSYRLDGYTLYSCHNCQHSCHIAASTATTWMGTAATIFKVANKALDIDTKYKRSPKGSPTAKFCDLHTDEQRLHRPTQC